MPGRRACGVGLERGALADVGLDLDAGVSGEDGFGALVDPAFPGGERSAVVADARGVLVARRHAEGEPKNAEAVGGGRVFAEVGAVVFAVERRAGEREEQKGGR